MGDLRTNALQQKELAQYLPTACETDVALRQSCQREAEVSGANWQRRAAGGGRKWPGSESRQDPCLGRYAGKFRAQTWHGEINEGANLWHRHPTMRREQMHRQRWMLRISQQDL